MHTHLMTLLTCLALSTGAPAATVHVTVTGKDGQPLPDAVVVIEVPNDARPRAPQPLSATISQQKMQFQPTVSVLPLGSRVRFINLDSWEHHVRGIPGHLMALNAGPAAGFELRLDGKAEGKAAHSAEVTLSQAGPLQLGCHLHSSMRGFLYVADTPWAVKTDATGVAQLQDVPEGAARLRVWHADQLLEPAMTPIHVQPVTVLLAPTQIVPRRRRT